MKKIKYKYRTLSDKLTMLYPLVKNYKKSYHENRKFLKIKNEKSYLHHEKSYLHQMELAVAFLIFYQVKKAYKYFYLKEIRKRKYIKKPKCKNFSIKLKNNRYTLDSLFSKLYFQ